MEKKGMVKHFESGFLKTFKKLDKCALFVSYNPIEYIGKS